MTDFASAPSETATMPTTRRWRRRLFRVARSAVTIYLLVCLVLYALQAKLIFPGSATQGTRDAQVDALPGTELLHLKTASGTPIVAMFGKALLPSGAPHPAAAGQPTVLYFYGNGMCLADALGEFDLFRRLGCNCIATEYAGYGMSGGDASERGCYDSAEAAYQHLLARRDIDPHKLISAGWSLGGAVAIDLAWRHREDGTIRGLITFCTFTSMTELAQYHYPVFPISMLLQYRFPSEEKLRSLKVPHFLGHGCCDPIVPFSHAERLAAVPHGRLTRYTCKEASHNDFFECAQNDLPGALAHFLEQF